MAVQRVLPWPVARQRQRTAPLSRQEQRALESIRKLAWLMDARWGIGPLRFGLESVVGLVPAVGDAVSTGAALYQVVVAVRLGVPARSIGRMLTNSGIDFAVGLVPVLGDLVDTFFKAHLRNQQIIEQHVRIRETAAGPAHTIPVRSRRSGNG